MQSAVVISCLSQMVKETLEAIVLYLCKEVSERASCVVISHYIILVCFNFLFNIHKGSSQSHLLVMGMKRRDAAVLSAFSYPASASTAANAHRCCFEINREFSFSFNIVL